MRQATGSRNVLPSAIGGRTLPAGCPCPTGSTVEVRRGALVTLLVVIKNMGWLRSSSSLNVCRVLFIVAVMAATCAQVAAAPPTNPADDVSPPALVRSAVANEVAAS